MTDPDPISTAARAAAGQLAADYGPTMPTDVEAELATQGTTERPGQYFDPISLGSLLVAIATLAWTIYNDKRKQTPNPSPDVVARQVRVELRNQGDTRHSQHDINRVTEVVVTEIIQAAEDQR
jgi:hypothetical protein